MTWKKEAEFFSSFSPVLCVCAEQSFRLVVSPPLKNSQLRLSFPIYGKMKVMFPTTNQNCLVYAKFNGLSCMVPGYRGPGPILTSLHLCWRAPIAQLRKQTWAVDEMPDIPASNLEIYYDDILYLAGEDNLLIIYGLWFIYGLYMVNRWIIYGSGWWLTYPSEKYEFVNWDADIPNIWKNEICFKPPTRWWYKFEQNPLIYHDFGRFLVLSMIK